MPATLTYPGVYVDEVPSAVRTINFSEWLYFTS